MCEVWVFDLSDDRRICQARIFNLLFSGIIQNGGHVSILCGDPDIVGAAYAAIEQSDNTGMDESCCEPANISGDRLYLQKSRYPAICGLCE